MIVEAYEERELNSRAQLKQSVVMTKALGKMVDSIFQIPETNDELKTLNKALYERN